MGVTTTVRLEGAEEFQRQLEQLLEGVRKKDEFLRRVSDIFSEEAEISIDRAQSVPLDDDTLRKRRKRGATSTAFLPPDGGMGLRGALTSDFFARSPIARREIVGDGILLWGTKRWVKSASLHMQFARAPSKWMPARIDLFVGESAAEIEQRVEHAGREWVAEQMERAGWGLDEIRAALGDDVL